MPLDAKYFSGSLFCTGQEHGEVCSVVYRNYSCEKEGFKALQTGTKQIKSTFVANFIKMINLKFETFNKLMFSLSDLTILISDNRK